ncbi:MAG: glycosyltransferase family 39 protein [Candidatus Poribacteria bacterium]|nr:glycosyltransferase family 39 protein [Candidatus Poribacteria bacterium]
MLLFPSSEWSRLRYVEVFFLFSFFIIASGPRLLSLDAHWSSDEARWLRRSAKFISAVKKGEFSETAIAHHPGVTTMWVAGFRTFFTQPRVNVENLALSRMFIGIIIWAGIGLASLLLYQLFGRWIVLASFACFAYSPLFLAQTRRLHTDALATTFLLLTVLLFFNYCQDRQRRHYLIFSGTAYGLTLLSKSYALILLLWVPLCLCLFREKSGKNFWTYLAEGLCFLNCALLTVFSLWPFFWTPILGIMAISLLGLTFLLLREVKSERCPAWLVAVAFAGLCLVGMPAIQTVWLVFEKVNWAVTTPHEVEHFFLGKVVNDPGWLFYPFVLMIKSTPLMLPLALLGCILLWKQRKRTEETARHFKIGLALVVGVLLFTICLSATSKKFPRYLLPAFPMLEILAAIGFVEGFKWCYTRLVSRFGTEAIARYKTKLAVFACIGFFFIQVFPVLARHPYYGTYYNLCWKVTNIPKIITVGDASGLDIAANYLNKKADAHKLVVQVSPLAAEFVKRYFRGRAYRADRQRGHTPAYEVVYIRDSQIGRVPQTGTLNGELEAVITLNGIDHVWIYQIPPPEE